MYRKLFLLAFTTLAFLCVRAQNMSNQGTEFWVGYGHHQYFEPNQGNGQDMVIYLSAGAQAATVTVSIYGTAWSQTYSVAANTVISTTTIPKSGVYDARLYDGPAKSEKVYTNKAIHIVSDVPIVAYAHIYGSNNSGATMLMPVETWGYSYITLNSQQEYSSSSNGQVCFSWAYVISQHDNTTIEVTPSQTTRGGNVANDTYTLVLQKGEIYQFLAGPENTSIKDELTGSKIKSVANAQGECYPIAVFSGSSRTYNTMAICGFGGGDNDNQQCFPQQAWGKRYLTATTSQSTAANQFMTYNTFKVLVKDPTTVLRRNGSIVPAANLIANSYYKFESSEHNYFEADKPIMVAQFITGGSGCMGGGVGDPEMIYLSPIEQGIKKIGFYRNTRQSITTNYLTLIIPNHGLASLKIDGANNAWDYSTPHPALSGYTIVVKRWAASQAQATAQSDSAFTAITYGLGSVESYGYNAGTMINNLNVIGSIRNNSDTSSAASHPFTCKGSPLTLSVLIAYQPTRMEWQLDQVPGLTPNTNQVFINPTPTQTVVVNGVTYYQYTLAGAYSLANVGNAIIPIKVTHPSIDNCNNTEVVSFGVSVHERPKPDFTPNNYVGCLSTPVQFNGIVNTNNSFTINQWNWTFHDATTSTLQNPIKTYSNIGTFNVTLSAVSTEGCLGDTTKQVTLVTSPQTSLNASTLSGCQGTQVTFTGTTNANGATITNWYWDFGDGSAPVTIASNTPQTHTYNTPGTYTVLYTANSTPCNGDTSRVTITVYQKPTASFSYPAGGCLDPSGLVQFTGISSSNGVNISSHSWNFGDANATPANPNTSTIQNPTHNYSTSGNYTITYLVTDEHGCTDDSVSTITLNLKPTLAYSALNAVCANAAPVSVANGSVTNSVPGTGVYHGPATTLGGMFDPAAAGAGTHTIWYVYTSNANCVDSISQTITVNPAPFANFSFNNAGCLPVNGLVQFNFTGSALPNQTYSWSFGDGGISTLQNPTHNYSTSGTYTITLTVNTALGCSDDSVYNATFNLMPALQYTALNSICANAAPVSVAQGSNTNGVAGTGVYHGPATTLGGMFDPSVAGAGTHTIWYVYTTSANCVDSISQTITVKPAPFANFSFSNAGCLPVSGLLQFNFTGSALPNQTYSWSFGDGGTSTLQNPTHNYSTSGTYTITLTVNTALGCSDDSVYNATFNLMPALQYTALNAICANAAPVSVAQGSNTNGVAGTGVYHGPATTLGGMFDPSVAGAGTHTIWYVYTSNANCVDSISQTITVKPAPFANFSFSNAGCLPVNGLVQFNFTGSALPNQAYSWAFGDGGTSTLQNPTHNYSTSGTYTITLTVNSALGCSDDSVYNATFNLMPALQYAPLPAVCSNIPTVSVASGSITNGIAGTGVYHGPATTTNGVFTPAAAGIGTHTICYVYTTNANCVDSVSQTIVVNPSPNANFAIQSANCLPTSGTVQFNYTGTVLPGQVYSWNFGDANATPANPNTSTAQNPTHNYINSGNYTITLNVNSGGCFDDTVYNATFNVTPVLDYQPLAALCEGTPVLSIATATVTNGVTGGQWTYSGPGTSAAGMFDPTAAGPGLHTITAAFTSAAGCSASITQQIRVHPRPTAHFDLAATDVCENSNALITNNSTIVSGSIQNWNWNFGDGNTQTLNNGTPFTHAYTAFGAYTISLTAVSDNQCNSLPYTQTINIRSNPIADFTMPQSVCMPNNAATFTSTSTTGDNTSMNFTWNFGDGNTGTGSPASHVYQTISSYNVTLNVTTQYGCTATKTKAFDAFFDKPVAYFTVSDSAFCQGKRTTFKDESTAPNSTITARKWIFGDGSTSTAATYPKMFSQPGLYNVKLVVWNAQGCISDTFTKPIRVYVQPVVDAGPNFYVALGDVIQLQPKVNDSSASIAYHWTPEVGLTNPYALRPLHVANGARIYTLTATGDGGCTASDYMSVNVYRPITIPNAFSPNGDGINDKWEITNLTDYMSATVEVYNRYGQMVYRAPGGYVKPWDGTMNGKPLPVGTYYYIIDLKDGKKPLNGPITIIK